MVDRVGHCHPYSNGRAGSISEIKSRRSKGIQVILSIGGGAGSYYLASNEDARQGATYLLEQLSWRPLLLSPIWRHGPSGVDFDIEGGTNQYWDDLARYMSSYVKEGMKVHWTAAPQYPCPDAWVGGASRRVCSIMFGSSSATNALCQYTPGKIMNLALAWK